MEKRLLLFFAVTFLLVSLWPRLFPPPTPDPLPGAAADVTEPSTPAEGTGDIAPAPDESASVAEEIPQAEDRRAAEREEVVVVETDVYRLELSNRGARILSARLKDHQDDHGRPYELVSRAAAEHTGSYPLDLRLETAAKTEEVQTALFQVTSPAARPIRLTGAETADLHFVWADGKGLEVEKRLRFEGGSYGVDVVVSVRENGDEVGKEVLFGPGLGTEVSQSQYRGVEKGVIASRGEVALFSASDLDEAGTGVSVDATGVASHYFAALMLPEPSGLYGARLERTTVPESVENGETRKQHDVITAALESQRAPAAFHLFMGPKQLELLEDLQPGLSKIIEFGEWMRYPALLLRQGLVWLYGFVGNYGWAIVLLTVVINLLLVPLKHYSFVSMRKMQKLAPQIQRIRDRYKKVKPTDPRYQHMNQEIMSLYKEHKVSPVSGCLPMLLMIPFFFAFYRLLMASIELRHAPFMLWIADLSRHDPYFVLPILMGVSQIAIQKMTPQTTADPIQAKIMQFMPVMFTFILAWAPAGLVLYWFANNLVSMAQQVVTNRLLEGGEDGDGGARGAKAKKAEKQALARG
ncbi:MAG: membrane protein insertase YidC [Vicinamibacteria bacterium]